MITHKSEENQRAVKIAKNNNHTPEQLPYTHLAHWPPLTYRNNQTQSAEALKAFTDFLQTEDTSKQPKELQPWIPFCESKCSFCYFPVNCERETYNLYVKTLKKALQFYSKTRYVKSSIFTELYIGGGTPAVLSEEQIADLLDYCRSSFNYDKDCQTKFTASTASLTYNKLKMLSSRKVNQVDVGVQTFNDKFRKTLLLQDKSAEAQQKVKAIKKTGLDVSIDLLYNLPGQTLEEWENDIKLALELEVESMDCYPLELYDNTPLSRSVRNGRLPALGDCRQELEMYRKAYQLAKANGYAPTCHNRFSRIREDFKPPSAEVIGTGAGFFMGHIGPFHYHDVENVQEYIASIQDNTIPKMYLSKLSKEEEIKKAIMMLYVRTPVKRADFKAKFGMYPEEAFPKAIKDLLNRGLIAQEGDELRLTEKGDPWRVNIAWDLFK
jgi:coproporphyrinogen III oxidase-like Fe-S oxidoreductase